MHTSSALAWQPHCPSPEQSAVPGRSKRVELAAAFSTSQGHIGLNASKKLAK